MTLEERLSHFLGRRPQIDSTAYISPLAYVAGAVTLGPFTSVWPMAVVRADLNTIEVGEGTNLQDGAIIHLADEYPTRIGNYVTVGHRATVHACTVEDECLIGMGSTILDGAVIGRNSIIGAHALVTHGVIIPPGSLVLGMPGKVVRRLDDEEIAGLKSWAEKYVVVARHHREREKALRK